MTDAKPTDPLRELREEVLSIIDSYVADDGTEPMGTVYQQVGATKASDLKFLEYLCAGCHRMEDSARLSAIEYRKRVATHPAI